MDSDEYLPTVPQGGGVLSGAGNGNGAPFSMPELTGFDTVDCGCDTEKIDSHSAVQARADASR